jgi:hypothetical protein
VTGDETATLKAELEHFKKEKEHIRNLIGEIGGAKYAKRDKIINILFITLIMILFSLDVLRHLLQLKIPLPPLFSLEIGILFVSVKIIWMIHKQSKVEHFQFWILNSIEFRLNNISKILREMQR